MAGKNTITINGKSYDAITGKPVAEGQHIAHKPTGSQTHRAFNDISGPPRLHVTPVLGQPSRQHSEIKALAVHQKLQKSQTLHRAALKKPVPLRQLTPTPITTEANYAPPDEQQRSPAITKFGPSHHATSQTSRITTPVAAAPAEVPRVHPVVAKALASQPAPAPQSSKELKEALIRERLAEAEPNVEHHAKHQRRITSQPRMATILISSLALLLLAGYLTYINLPNISMRVAATRAGIAANYPNYNPDGYHFAGPITYQPGEVNITFRSNTNNRNFNITQKSSSWDSQAVLDNYVSKKTGTYLTYQERGLTVYSFGSHAAWVNGGLLYTIDGDAPLSSDQLLHIATSM
jgi:hypothetical protein